MSNWTHTVCEKCWHEHNPHPNRQPVRVIASARKPERCCYCGIMHTSGIFIRRDPALMECKGECGLEGAENAGE